MSTIVLALLIPALGYAQGLATRLQTASCQDLMTDMDPDLFATEAGYWARHQSAAVFEGPGEVHVYVDPLSTDQAPRDLLDALATSTPPPFARRYVPFAAWRMGVWAKSNESGTRQAWIIADRLSYDPRTLEVTGGEFVIEAHYDRRISADVVEAIAQLAHARTGLPPEKLRGLRSPEALDRGIVFMILDLVGDARFRYQQTLRLMKFMNQELEELDLP